MNNYGLFFFLKFCKYNETINGCSDWPTCHKRDFFFPFLSVENFHISWFYNLFLTDDIGEFLLVVVNNDFISEGEFIKKSKNTVVFPFYPWIIGTMSKYETISYFSWFCSSWVTNNSFLEFLHENIFHVVEIESCTETYIHKWNIFSDFWDNNSIIVRSYIEIDADFYIPGNELFRRKSIFPDSHIIFLEFLLDIRLFFLVNCFYNFSIIRIDHNL